MSSEFHVMCFPTRILLCVLTTNAASSVSLAISNMKYYSSVISELPTPPTTRPHSPLSNISVHMALLARL